MDLTKLKTRENTLVFISDHFLPKIPNSLLHNHKAVLDIRRQNMTSKVYRDRSPRQALTAIKGMH